MTTEEKDVFSIPVTQRNCREIPDRQPNSRKSFWSGWIWFDMKSSSFDYFVDVIDVGSVSIPKVVKGQMEEGHVELYVSLPVYYCYFPDLLLRLQLRPQSQLLRPSLTTVL